MSDRNFYRQLRSILERESVAVATIVRAIGSAPREVGAKMAICADRSIIGTIGGGAGEAKVIERALLVLKTGEKQLVEIDLTGAPGKDIQGVCGGKVRVWLETWTEDAIALVEKILELFQSGQSAKLITPLTQDAQPYLTSDFTQKITSVSFSCSSAQFRETIQPPPSLLIIGGGHVAVSLAQIASFSGFQIAVTDDRPEFITSQRFPQGVFLSESIARTLDRFATYQQLFIALVTRGLSQDVEALQAILQKSIDYQYLGAIGSQKRIDMIRQAVRQQEIPNFYAPIGLDIGALTPEEIAISITAEIIKVRRGGTGLSLSDRIQHSKSSKVHIEEMLYAKLS